MKVQPEIRDGFVYNLRNAAGFEFFKKEPWNVERCPNPVGTILYAKETFNDEGCACYEPCSCERYWYRADMPDNDPDPPKWKPSIFMPKAASRLWFEVMRVRVERVNEISEADAKAEGILCPDKLPFGAGIHCHIRQYRYLWNSINGPGSFDSAPWVWVYDLKRIPKPL